MRRLASSGMVETAAHLTDHLFPRLSVRQWVLAAISISKPY
jgi:hypothetical protein